MAVDDVVIIDVDIDLFYHSTTFAFFLEDVFFALVAFSFFSSFTGCGGMASPLIMRSYFSS